MISLNRSFSACLFAGVLPATLVAAPLGSSFTFQGRLTDGGNPANATYDLRIRLWNDPTSLLAADQVGSTICLDDVAVTNGLFTVVLNAGGEFGPNAFDGAERFLEIGVRAGSAGTCSLPGGFITLTPRQPLTAAPYALHALNSFWSDSGADIINTNAGNVGIGTTSPQAKLHVAGDVLADGFLRSLSPNQDSEVFLGWGVDENGDDMARIRIGGNGVGASNGLDIQKVGNVSIMRIQNSGRVGIGTSTPTVRLDVVGGSGAQPAVQAVGHWGVYGQASTTDGYGGVFASDEGVLGGIGRALLVGGDSEISGSLLVGNALVPTAAKLQVVNGTDSEPGGGGFLVVGSVNSTNISIDNNEIMARSNGATSTLFLNNDGGDIVAGGNVGIGTGSPDALLHSVGSAASSRGAVYGVQTGGSTAGAGVFGVSTLLNGNGVIGRIDVGPGAFGVWGISSTGDAGHFSGDVDVVGEITKDAGAFKIDHPLDPANKYLYHSFVESPDMMNVYNGNVVTDADGYATVTLPAWFEAVNRDFRYQLTVLDEADSDAFVMAKVVGKIVDNRFTIRTSAANVEVSWQVTGIRQDAWADAHRIPVEVDKPDYERGFYRHPELYGQPLARKIEEASHPGSMTQPPAGQPHAPQGAKGTN